METTDEQYMRRCLQLAAGGMMNAKPNPMVGAVIVHQGRIIGEGYHVRCGEGHAEVNAFASVRAADEPLLPQSTIYVSLEPCSHYGKTPPCADLIIRKGVRRVVVGCVDPFSRVSGRGIQRLLDAGIEVTVGVLEEECMLLNRRFMTSNTARRPFVTLKWCQSEGGFIDDRWRPVMLSTAFTQMLSHKLRSESDAILVGRITDERDHPQLTTRHWSGPSPMRIVIDRRHPCFPELDFQGDVPRQICQWLHREGKQSLIVEGGARTISSFLESGMWDELRVETSPRHIAEGTRAPEVPASARLVREERYDGNAIRWYRRTAE